MLLGGGRNPLGVEQDLLVILFEFHRGGGGHVESFFVLVALQCVYI